jgi:hypothetical protein
MNTALIKKSAAFLTEYIALQFPATGWYFCSEAPPDVILPDSERWRCMFQYIDSISNGRKVGFSLENPEE